VADLDLDQLRQVFLADQAAAAHEEAAELFARMAGGRGVDYSHSPSPWVLRLVRQARRNRCPHWPREDGTAVVFVAAHVGRLECRACSVRTAKALAGSLDEGRCDLCREQAELEVFAFHVGTLLITGRCCAGCRATVYGEAA
jgi:hypothetical protein